MPHPFDRYSAFTDVPALKHWSGKPLRKSLRVNMLKNTVEGVRSWGEKKGWQMTPVPWCPEGFYIDRVDRAEALGKDLLHILGHIYIQEAASMLPVALLNPQPGEAVLDMSAAPGSKTTQIASAMQGRGVIVANDVQEKRIWALSSNLQRSSVLNVMITRHVGQWFAKNMTGRFDRVLCDAPCTAQGTVRKDSDALSYCSADNTDKMCKIQKELLESAIHSTKIGGTIVYATCTLTPEENEGVVMEMLRRFPDQIEVVDPREEDLELGGWDMGKAIEDSHLVQKLIDPERKNLLPCLRLWPQTYDTEGFFSVLIRKTATTKDRVVLPMPQTFQKTILPGSRQKAFRNSVEDWFGSSFVREDELLFQNKESMLITTNAIADFAMPSGPYLVGMPFGRDAGDMIVRVSQEILTLRGREATKQVVNLDHDEMKAMLRGQNIEPKNSTAENGDIILCLDGIPLCRGVLKDGKVLNRLPREIVQMYA